MHSEQKIISIVKQWVERFVVGLNLCPFAKHELVNNRLQFSVSTATTQKQLLVDLQAELERLNNESSIETTLLIHPEVLQNFDDFNQFLVDVDHLLIKLHLSGIYQVASFHPNYQFSGTDSEDAENYTNRSPYPMLHLLREASLERAIANYTNVDQIPARNIALMNSLGVKQLKAMNMRLDC